MSGISTYCWFKDLLYVYTENEEERLKLQNDYRDFLACTKIRYAKDTTKFQSFVERIKDTANIYGLPPCNIL